MERLETGDWCSLQSLISQLRYFVYSRQQIRASGVDTAAGNDLDIILIQIGMNKRDCRKDRKKGLEIALDIVAGVGNDDDMGEGFGNGRCRCGRRNGRPYNHDVLRLSQHLCQRFGE